MGVGAAPHQSDHGVAAENPQEDLLASEPFVGNRGPLPAAEPLALVIFGQGGIHFALPPTTSCGYRCA